MTVSSDVLYRRLLLYLLEQSTDTGREEAEVESSRLRRELEGRCRELELEKQVHIYVQLERINMRDVCGKQENRFLEGGAMPAFRPLNANASAISAMFHR